MSEWQPIETAPRPGTTILMWLKNPHYQDVAQGFRPLSQVVVGDLGEQGNMIISPLGSYAEVTHWMPLPEGPGHKQERLANIARANQ